MRAAQLPDALTLTLTLSFTVRDDCASRYGRSVLKKIEKKRLACPAERAFLLLLNRALVCTFHVSAFALRFGTLNSDAVNAAQLLA